MAYTSDSSHKRNDLDYLPSYDIQLDQTRTPNFRSSQGLEHQSSMLGALSGVPFVGKVASGYQKALNAQIDRQFQEYMARLGFEFTNQQREKQNLYNYWVAQEFMDKQNQWNSYSNQVAEMKKAGLNPAGIFGEGQLTGNNSSQSAPTGGAPSGSATGIGYQSQTDTGGMSDIADFANVLKSLADAKKSGAETKSIESMLDEQIKDLQLRNDYQQILNTYQGKKSATEIAKMLQDIERQYVDIDNLIKEGKLTEANIRLAEVNRELAEENKGKAKAERELAEELADKRKEYTQNILNQQKAETKKTQQEGNAAQAQGEAAKQNAATNAAVGASQVEANKASADLSRAQKKVQESIDELNKLDIRNKKSWHYKLRQFNENLNAAMRENIYTMQQKQEFGIIQQRLMMAIKANDTYMISLLTGQASAIMGAAAATAKAAK